jgi:lantibiotic modifying enzyme
VQTFSSLIFLSLFFIGAITNPQNLQTNNNSIQNYDSPEEIKDNEMISPEAAAVDYLDSLSMAIQTAEWLYSESTKIGGKMSWTSDSRTYINQENGASGIGEFFLNLYEQTLNKTYLNWSQQIGAWLVSIDADLNGNGKWPMYFEQIGSENLTGYSKGAVGVGMFLNHLYDYTLNQTYKDLAEKIASYLLSSANFGSNEMRIKYKDFIPQTGPFLLPVSGNSSTVSVNETIGTKTGINDNFSNWIGKIDLNPASSSNIAVFNNGSVLSNISLSVPGTPNQNGTYVSQSFQLSNYPAYIDENSGMSVRLYTTIINGTGYMNLTIFEADINGFPTQVQVGNVSNDILATDVLNDTNSPFVTFNWTGKDNVPILNGTSKYGYAFVIRFGSGINWTVNQSFILRTTRLNQYTGGRFYLQTSEVIGQDLCFNLTAKTDPDLLAIDFSLNATDFGIMENFSRNDIVSLEYNFALNSTTDNAITGIQIFNQNLNIWEFIGNFDSNLKKITGIINQPAVSGYFGTESKGPIRFRIFGGRDGGTFSVQLYQMNVSVLYSGERYYYNLADGVTGIAEFFLKCYESFGNSSYLNYASLLANYLLNNSITTGNSIYWLHNGSRDLTYLNGDAGIISFLLHLSQYNSTNIYRSVANVTGLTIIGVGTDRPSYTRHGDYRPVENWVNYFNTRYTGKLVGIAGIGNILLDLAKTLAPEPITSDYSFYSAARKIGFALESTEIYSNSTWGPLKASFGGVEFYTEIANGRIVSLTAADGMAGIISFLARLQREGFDSEFGGIVGNALDHLNSSMLSPGQWNLSSTLNGTINSKYGLFYGMAGIANELSTIQLRASDAKNYGDIVSSSYHQNYGIENKTGLAEGLAGSGLAAIKQYRSTNNISDYNYAIWCSSRLMDNTLWQYRMDQPSAIYNGMSNGYAGIGLYFLELYKLTGNSSYLDRAKIAGNYLVGLESGGKWQVSNQDPNYKTDYSDGAAGIIDYLLQLYLITQNITYRNTAEAGLAWLISEMKPEAYWTVSTTVSTVYLGYYYGVAGIADVFLNAYLITKNTQYLSISSLATNYLTNIVLNSPYMFYKSPTGENNLEYVGYDYGYAGFWKLLRNIGKYNDTDGEYLQSLENTYTRLMYQLMPRSSGNDLYFPDYYSSNNPSLTTPSLSIIHGMVGLMEELQYLYPIVRDENILDYISKMKNYILTRTDYDNKNGYLEGIQGTAAFMGKILDISLPEIPSYFPITPPSIEYFQSLDFIITARDYGSSIDSVALRYRINTETAYTTVILPSSGTGQTLDYQYSLGPYPYATNVYYHLVIRDKAGLTKIISANPTSDFMYTVQDTVLPIANNATTRSVGDIYPTLVFGKDGYGGGYVDIDVFEPAYASGINSVLISYYESSNSSRKLENMYMTKVLNSNTYTYRIPTNIIPLNATNQLICNFTVSDFANNVYRFSQNFTIGDFDAPQLLTHLLLSNRPTYYNDESVDIEVLMDDNVTYGGAGFERVYIRYSNNINQPVTEWNTITLSFKRIQTYGNYTGFVFGGTIGPQKADQTIYYYICAKDKAGNEVGYNKVGGIIPIDELPDDVWYYNIRFNWWKPIMYIGLIVGIAIVVYLVYTFRGNYLDRMRREASSQAIFIVIKEKFAAIYYSIMGSLNKIGDRISEYLRAATIKERIDDFVKDHVNSPILKAWVFIWTSIKTYFKYTLLAIIAPIYLVWRVIVGAKGRQILFTALIGVGLIVATVIKYFSADFYPIRAMFFINFGFILFIASFALIIVHLIYEIAYK